MLLKRRARRVDGVLTPSVACRTARTPPSNRYMCDRLYRGRAFQRDEMLAYFSVAVGLKENHVFRKKASRHQHTCIQCRKRCRLFLAEPNQGNRNLVFMEFVDRQDLGATAGWGLMSEGSEW